MYCTLGRVLTGHQRRIVSSCFAFDCLNRAMKQGQPFPQFLALSIPKRYTNLQLNNLILINYPSTTVNGMGMSKRWPLISQTMLY